MAGGGDDHDKEGGEGFLSRWSRVKARPERDADIAVAPLPINAMDAAAIPPQAVEDGAADLPRLEDILPEGSIAQFLRKGIPQALTKAALRQAWTQDPRIRDFIEVAENQYDFNNPAGIYGFGELPADTDIAALVRQATGFGYHEPDKSPDDEGENIAGNERLAQDSTRLSQPLSVADDGGQTAPDSVAAAPLPASEMVMEQAVAGAVQPDAPSPPVRPRRHGGALPV